MQRFADLAVEGVPQVTVSEVFRVAAERFPDTCAARIVADDPRFVQEISYGELYARGRQLAAFLRGHCSHDAPKVGILAPNCVEWLVVQCAAALVGAALVPLNPRLPAAEIAYILDDAEVDVLFLWPAYRSYDLWERVTASAAADTTPLVAMDPAWTPPPGRHQVTRWGDALRASPASGGALPEPQTGDTALVLYTSGSSGAPKAVALPGGVLTKNAADMMHRWGVGEGEIWCTPAPYFHIVGASMLTLGCAAVGASQTSFPRFDADLVMSVVEGGHVRYLQTVPTTLRALLDLTARTGRRPAGLRLIEIGGAPVPVDLQAATDAQWHTPLLNCYGLTETAGVITQVAPGDPHDKQVATVGRAVAGVRLRVVDQDGREVGPGEPGELQSAGYAAMSAYLGKPAETERAFTPDGWFRTGDLATIDEQGFVTITGRIGEMIKRGAERVEPAEVERLLRRHPAIDDVAVFGLPDSYWGQIVCAAVVVTDREARDPDDLVAWARSNLPPHLAPSRYAFVDEIPVTDSGKVRRALLRERLDLPTS